MMTAMTERAIIKIAVRPESKAAIDETVKRYGMTQQEVASRAFEWLAEQDETIQAAVLGLLPRGHETDIAEMVLSKMTGKQRPRIAAKPARGKTS